MIRISAKEILVKDLFARTAPRYDIVNRVMSFGLNTRWKSKAVSLAGIQSGGIVLDVCCGTGDLSFSAAKCTGSDGLVVGIDVCIPMLSIAKAKLDGKTAVFTAARAEAIPIRSDSADAVLIGFALRNVSDLHLVISEMARVLKPGGSLVILETSTPKHAAIAALWRFYMRRIVPLLAAAFGAPKDAYQYFQQSVMEFISRGEVASLLSAHGLSNVKMQDMGLGSVCVYSGNK